MFCSKIRRGARISQTCNGTFSSEFKSSKQRISPTGSVKLIISLAPAKV